MRRASLIYMGIFLSPGVRVVSVSTNVVGITRHSRRQLP